MSEEEATVNRSTDPPAEPAAPALTRHDMDRLTNYKWRYSLESHGFSSEQTNRLLFMKWLYSKRAVRS